LQSKQKKFKKILTAENSLFIRLFGGFCVLSKNFFQKYLPKRPTHFGTSEGIKQ